MSPDSLSKSPTNTPWDTTTLLVPQRHSFLDEWMEAGLGMTVKLLIKFDSGADTNWNNIACNMTDEDLLAQKSRRLSTCPGLRGPGCICLGLRANLSMVCPSTKQMKWCVKQSQHLVEYPRQHHSLSTTKRKERGVNKPNVFKNYRKPTTNALGSPSVNARESQARPSCLNF